MTAFTPNEQFPYPQSTDPFAVTPDDTGFPQQSRDLAYAVQGKINAEPSFLVRRPFFKASMNVATTFTFNSGATVVFDTIEVDTVGTIIDLSRASGGAFLTKGIWQVGATMVMNPTATTTPFGEVNLILATAQPTTSNVKQSGQLNNAGTYDGGGTLTNYMTKSYQVYCNAQTSTSVVPSVFVQVDTTGGTPPASGVVTVTYVDLWGFWVSDLP